MSNTKKQIKIAYIGGGSKEWARVFMNDLALSKNVSGEIGLYDIDVEAARRNMMIGERIALDPACNSAFKYVVYERLDDALVKADFVVLSILPATFKEMRSDVHEPEKYGIYQAVGDTVGPGGILRAMRTVPIYEEFANAIKRICPEAFVINLTNPMSICVETLCDILGDDRVIGCCHEVFHALDFLTLVYQHEFGGERINRDEVEVEVAGTNHFTWIGKATYEGIDILKLIPSFIEDYYETGYYENPSKPRDSFLTDTFCYGNKVKMELFKRYGILAAAGDRHLVEFLPNKWFLESEEAVRGWLFGLTTVDQREKMQAERIQKSIDLAAGKAPINLEKSQEKCVEIIECLLGYGVLETNANARNNGRVRFLKDEAIVETKMIFKKNEIIPLNAGSSITVPVQTLISRNVDNILECYHGIKERNLKKIFNSFINQPLCGNLNLDEGKKLFVQMVKNTREYLDPYYPDLDTMSESL